MTPAFSGIPSAQHVEKTRSGDFTRAVSGTQIWARWLHNPAFSEVPTALPSQESPMPRTGKKSERATSHLSSWGPKSGQDGCTTPAFSRVPSAQNGGKISSGPHLGKTATYPLPSRRSPVLSTGKELDMAQISARWLLNLCLLGSPVLSTRGNQNWTKSGQDGYMTLAFSWNSGQKSEVAPSPWPFGGPTCGHNGYITPHFLGIPNTGTKLAS